MPKYIITWNAGYGVDADEVDCESLQEAEQIAYDAWREAAESNASYDAVEWNASDAYELGLTDEDPDEEDDPWDDFAELEKSQ